MKSHLGLVWIFLFFNHSSLLTQFPSLVTHHSSLKIPQFLIPTCVAHFTQLFITQFFYFFVRPTPEHNVKPRLAYLRNIYSSQPFSPHIFPLQPTYSPRTLNKPNEAANTIITIQLNCCFFFMPSSVTRASFCCTERVQC